MIAVWCEKLLLSGFYEADMQNENMPSQLRFSRSRSVGPPSYSCELLHFNECHHVSKPDCHALAFPSLTFYKTEWGDGKTAGLLLMGVIPFIKQFPYIKHVSWIMLKRNKWNKFNNNYILLNYSYSEEGLGLVLERILWRCMTSWISLSMFLDITE